MTTRGDAPSETGPDEGDRWAGGDRGSVPPPESGAPYPVGYSYSGYSGYPDRQAGTNPLAIFALAVAVAGVVSAGLVGGAGAVLGMVLGTVALIQIKRSPQGGRALAVAAVVVSVATLLVSLVLRAMALHG